jgi:hypothetical protein
MLAVGHRLVTVLVLLDLISSLLNITTHSSPAFFEKKRICNKGVPSFSIFSSSVKNGWIQRKLHMQTG